MKNIILVFLVFIANILNGQSVNPETFPTVIGEIGNKNLYTNTGGEGKVSIKTIMDSVTSVSIPLSGTRVGEPVIGDIEFIQNGYKGLKTLNSNGDDYHSLQMGDGGIIVSSKNYPTTETRIEVIDSDGRILLTTNNPNPIGYSCSVDCTTYIGNLDYTQKIYVDTKASKLGADDIEITDFNKGVILTSPNGSRYRITVDNSGILSTTIIP